MTHTIPPVETRSCCSWETQLWGHDLPPTTQPPLTKFPPSHSTPHHRTTRATRTGCPHLRMAGGKHSHLSQLYQCTQNANRTPIHARCRQISLPGQRHIPHGLDQSEPHYIPNLHTKTCPLTLAVEQAHFSVIKILATLSQTPCTFITPRTSTSHTTSGTLAIELVASPSPGRPSSRPMLENQSKERVHLHPNSCASHLPRPVPKQKKSKFCVNAVSCSRPLGRVISKGCGGAIWAQLVK